MAGQFNLFLTNKFPSPARLALDHRAAKTNATNVTSRTLFHRPLPVSQVKVNVKTAIVGVSLNFSVDDIEDITQTTKPAGREVG